MMKINQEMATKLAKLAASRVEEKYGFDETAIDYEAARLDRYPVVFAVSINGATLENFDSADVVVCKGAQLCFAYCRGEITDLDFVSVGTLYRDAAYALQRAFERRAGARRLTVVK